MSHDGERPHPTKDGSWIVERRYSSFTIRIWQITDSSSFDRVEIRHIQRDIVMTGKQVDVEWIRVAIVRLLDDSTHRSGEPNG